MDDEDSVVYKVVNFFKSLIPYVVIIVLVILFKEFVASPIKVNGDSMYPTLRDKDLMILDNISYRFGKIARGEVVVVKIKDEYIIKRVIGLPGEKVEYKDGVLYINGVKKYDPFAKVTDNFTAIVPDGRYYVLGDNRKNSTDSRYFGAFSMDEIKGHAVFVFYPLKRLGDVDVDLDKEVN